MFTLRSPSSSVFDRLRAGEALPCPGHGLASRVSRDSASCGVCVRWCRLFAALAATRMGGRPLCAEVPNLYAQAANVLAAYLGAEGFGVRATGGCGGRVLTVTTLDGDGYTNLEEHLNEADPTVHIDYFVSAQP